MAGEGIAETAAKESLHWTHGKHLRERKYSSPCRFLPKSLERQSITHSIVGFSEDFPELKAMKSCVKDYSNVPLYRKHLLRSCL